MYIPRNKTYNVTGTLNGESVKFKDRIGFNARQVFRRIRRSHPDISLMRAELVSASSL
jgi:hypothetical protein